MTDGKQPGNTSKGVIIQGSARSDGNTTMISRKFAEISGMSLIDLNDHTIKPFSYDQHTQDDDFLPLIKQLLEYDLIVISTPVYWYAMSAVLKVFFERFTDLLKWHKDLGRQLRGKSLAMISCSGHNDLDEFFSIPLRNTAKYLGMNYAGDVHTWVESGAVPPEAIDRMIDFKARLHDVHVTRVTS